MLGGRPEREVGVEREAFRSELELKSSQCRLLINRTPPDEDARKLLHMVYVNKRAGMIKS